MQTEMCRRPPTEHAEVSHALRRNEGAPERTFRNMFRASASAMSWLQYWLDRSFVASPRIQIEERARVKATFIRL
jgi:hypothetical protein